MNKLLGAARVLIVDDHPVVVKGLAALLDGERSFTIAGSAASVTDALQVLESTPIDLIIVDLSLKDSDGIELIKIVRNRFEDIKILVLSMHGGDRIVERVMKLGAHAFVKKEDADLQIVEAMSRILDGGTVLPRSGGTKEIKEVVDNEETTNFLLKLLSDREKQVLDLISEGWGNAKIAVFLKISHRTIEVHKENMKKKLNLPTSRDLTLFASRLKSDKQQ